MNVVYLDVYFCYNFLMDFFVFYLTIKLTNVNKSTLKLCLAAFVAATYSTAILIWGQNNVLEMIITYLVVPFVVSMLLVSHKTVKKVIRFSLTLYLVIFILSGIINAIYYSGMIGKNILERALNTSMFGINLWMVVVIIVILVAIIDGVRNTIRKESHLQSTLYKVNVVINGKQIEGIGLRDTGNQLVEPITKKPVIILENQLIEGIDKTLLKTMVIPYKTVGKEHGLMEGFVADRLEMEGVIVDKPILGIHEGSLSGKKEYNMILPPNIFNEERV